MADYHVIFFFNSSEICKQCNMCIYICTCIFVCMHTHIWMFMFHITYFWSGLQFCETAATFAIRVLQRFNIGFQQKALLEASIRCLNSISSCPHISQSINHRGGLFQILSKPVRPRPSPSGDAAKGPGLQEYAAEGAQLPTLPMSSPNPAGSPGRDEKQGCEGCCGGQGDASRGEPAKGEQRGKGRRGVAGSPVI